MSLAAAAALLLTALAAALVWPAAARLPADLVGPTTPRSRAVLPGLLLVAGAAGGVLLVGGGAHRVALALMAAAAALAVVRAVRRRRAATAAETRRDLVLASCEALVADLMAGQPPVTALERAGRDWPELHPVVTAARVDADVPEAFRHLAARPGAGELGAVAAAWQVAHETGSGLAGSLGQVVGSLRERRRTSRLVAGEVAAARATARLLAVLPLGVLGLGSSLGGDPFGFLLRTTPGLVCLGLGLTLCGLGWWWLDRLAAGVLDR